MWGPQCCRKSMESLFELGDRDILVDGCIDPVVGNEIAFGWIIIPEGVVAGRSIRNGLNESSAEKDVEEPPSTFGGPKRITRIRLTLPEYGPLRECLRGAGFVLEAE